MFAVVRTVEAIRYAGSIRQLKQLKKEISISLGGLPNARGAVEEEYQKLLMILMEEKVKTENELEDLPGIFKKGYTGFNGHANRHSSGIRLYLCSKIAKKLSVTIQTESELGKGTAVRLELPENK